MSNFDDVKQFHTKYDLLRPELPGLLSDDVYEFRAKFLEEEVREFRDAHEQRDLATAADSLIDLVYVACGTAVMMGLPWEAIWNAVQRANMQKVRAKNAAESKTGTGRGHAQDVIKPPGWKAPNVGLILAAYAGLKQHLGKEPTARQVQRLAEYGDMDGKTEAQAAELVMEQIHNLQRAGVSPPLPMFEDVE